MHDIEPHYLWREHYTSERDERSPFFGRVYSEFTYTNKVYNYFLHPQWDDFGSQTLYGKQLYADYGEGYALVELIGEWNDLLYNDIKFLKEEVVDPLLEAGVSRFVLFCEHVLNFHGDDNCYYEEWVEEARERGGWVALVNTLPHVEDELREAMVDHYVYFGEGFSAVPWRPRKPKQIVRLRGGTRARSPCATGVEFVHIYCMKQTVLLRGYRSRSRNHRLCQRLHSAPGAREAARQHQVIAVMPPTVTIAAQRKVSAEAIAGAAGAGVGELPARDRQLGS